MRMVLFYLLVSVTSGAISTTWAIDERIQGIQKEYKEQI